HDQAGAFLDEVGDLARGGVDVAQVGVAVLLRGCADGDHHHTRACEGWDVGGVAEVGPAGLHDLAQAVLVDGGLAARQLLDDRLLLVDAGDVVAQVGEGGTGRQTYVTGPDNRDVHQLDLSPSWLMRNSASSGGCSTGR